MGFEAIKEYASELLTLMLAAMSGYWLVAKSWATLSTRVTVLELTAKTSAEKLDDLARNMQEHRREQRDVLQAIDSKVTDIYKDMSRK
jgi:hypothetical protein